MFRVFTITTLLVLALLPLAGCVSPMSDRLISFSHGVAVGEDHLRYRVYLPKGYEENPQERYPLLIWFHGGGGSENSWGVRGGLGDRIALEQAKGKPWPFIVMSPSVGNLDVIRGEFEAALFDKALPRVHREYRTNGVVLAYGHSMGGLSAMMLSLRRPEIFRAVAVASPFLFDTSPFDTKRALTPVERERSPSTWANVYRRAIKNRFADNGDFLAYDPFTRIREFEGDDLPFELLLTSGTRDNFGLWPHNLQFHETMKDLGIDHDWLPQEGVGHGSVANPLIYEWLVERAMQPAVSTSRDNVTAGTAGGR